MSAWPTGQPGVRADLVEAHRKRVVDLARLVRRDGDALEHPEELRLPLEALLRLLAGGHVEEDAVEPEHLSRRPVGGLALVEDPAHLAVGADDPVLVRVRAARPRRPAGSCPLRIDRSSGCSIVSKLFTRFPMKDSAG